MQSSEGRRLPVGAEPSGGGVHFRVWAPKHEGLDVVLEDARSEEVTHALVRGDDDCFSGTVSAAAAGARYRFRTADGRMLPDPASRFQPAGPHGPSAVIDPDSFEWTDDDWPGPAAGRHVVYEMHIGTYTPAGTWAAAAGHLDEIAALGITIMEIMPVAEFPGRFNWGYDGVAPFAPAHVYGTPDDMRRFVDRAHALGLAVILDVVYNHMGPDGCYLSDFADEYFSTRHTTDWGAALNFDGPGSSRVREYFLANVEHWIREYHLDGLRFDATQNIYDTGPHHIVTELVARARHAAGRRRVWIVAENEPQEVRFVRDAAAGGHGMDAVWNDDFHHSAIVSLTGVTEAYYSDYRGTPQELISCARHGFLFQGQYYAWQRKARGTPVRGVPARAFVNYVQNHDQIANSASGLRIHELTSAGQLRAMTGLLLLMPGTAMLFQGQEFAASAPFLFFADHEPDLARRVHAGRRESLAQFRSVKLPAVQRQIRDPAAPATFEHSRIDHRERVSNEHVVRLHSDLIALSRNDRVFAGQDGESVDGAVLGSHALALRFRDDGDDDRLLIVNLGSDLHLHVVPEPLLAPPRGVRWDLLLSTEDLCYGGRGALHPEQDDGWLIPARSATVLVPAREPASRSNV
jgi:maltooligosyltrehalose trehalohydrolase